MTRLSLIGCGRWGRNILRDLVALECEVDVADPDAQARRHAETSGARRAVAEARDLPESDGIVIASSTSTHADLIELSLARGVPVFVEKPMTPDPRQARRLAEVGRERLFVMHKWRYHPGIEELRRVAETEELGRPLGMHLRHVGWGTPHRDVDATWILLPHGLSILLEVMGHVPPARHAFVERLDGVPVALSGVLGEDPWAVVEVSVRSPVKQREFRLHCEQGVAWLNDGWSGQIFIARGDGGAGGDAGQIESRRVLGEMPLLRELRTFVGHLGGGPPPRSSAEDGALIADRIGDLRRLAGLS